ncbi:hypothetical protein ABID52_001750 [Fictibacillus halophilus]|uniref:Uncharacterized protein n=1 Tax=Fictibacillus halophilus TaxID=1610490 RepID=A0ABV2LJ97_9BACL|nr:hypothetical protein [Fictibacillus halophilus]
MGWIGNNSGHHSCGCNKHEDHRQHECGCHKKVKHHHCGCHVERNMCDRCNWYKYRNDNEWRKLCRNRVESVRRVSESQNCALRNRLDNGTGR